MAFLLLTVGLAGCGGGQPVQYAPAAYGVTGQCYYVDSPAEAVALQAAGLCPSAWVPTLMPLLWHQQYYAYYSSSAFYGSYVGSSYRTVYISHSTTFQHSYSNEISAASASAKYKGSDGKTYTGNKIKSGSFSNGVKGFGGGKKCGLAAPDMSVFTKGGGGSGGSSGGSRSGGSYGGGTKGSGSGTKGSGTSGSKSKGGC